ncbi:MAG: galactose mutarotase [Dysgonamonadaceae bacterium]|jgi:aldose 1-epimerase|nr:galactose mutarotase [Dysgonamonadaceae bacterium]
MKKTSFVLFVTLCIALISCGKKEVETPTLSGLLPSKFEYTTEDGEVNRLYVLKNAQGMEVTVVNIGARIVSVVAPDKDGGRKNVVLGFDSIQPYLQPKNFYGAIVGRYANRIADGSFDLDRVTYRIRTNEGKNQLHGGPRGFYTRYFSIEQPDEQSVVCSYLSKDGEEGYPGNLKLTVTYTLTEANALRIDYQATTDRATYLNITNHAYFNLSGADANTLADHQLYIDAANYTPVREDLIPTGAIAPVEGAIDLTTLRPLDLSYQYDLNYVLNRPGDIDHLAAELYSSTTGIGMEVYTTEPGVQFYDDKARPSVCLETQHFPDSPHNPSFPSTVLRVDSVFNSQTIYKFIVK